MQSRKQGPMIALQPKHTQGILAMKDAARTPRRLLMGAGLLACSLVPMSFGTAAPPPPQSPAPDPQPSMATADTTSPAPSPLLPPGTTPMPLASDFNV